ncbi:sec-independent protein translocase protein TatA [Olsenella sp. KH1P3]|uniref:Sec-independent protein translocase protein TatA n=2 Tax=Parafannyhessea umbonata TaxID=604330 RepID=A0A1H6I314_9ACTN|nr:sec-independent protein translocase protein TatA [Parafannyhessea umbonata]SJZ55684.1 sec-independent protein translocase protein TatA [Olsenella sp. KH1P3]
MPGVAGHSVRAPCATAKKESNMIAGLGVPEMIVILFVALLIFGPQNLPKLGSALGKTVKNIREGMEEEGEKDTAPKSSQESED